MTPSPTHSFDQALSSLIGLGLGLLLLAGGGWVLRLQAHEQTTLTETQGTVVDSISGKKRNTDNSEKTTYAPVIEFWVRDQPIRFTGREASYRTSAGKQVVVRYNADSPATTARMVDPLEDLAAWGLFGLGGVAVVLSLGDLLLWRLRGPGR